MYTSTQPATNKTQSTMSSVPVVTLSSASAERIMPRIEQLATFSESAEGLTRQFASAEHRQANDLVANWMTDAGMQVHEDAIGNIIGRYVPQNTGASAPAIVLGSHLDTVINAGRFDGMLGVVSALAVVETLVQSQLLLPYAIEVIGFADEEGVRYQSTYLGSRAITGDLNDAVLGRKDKNDILFTDALEAFGKCAKDLPTAKRQPEEIRAYVELHIEQGPVLEQKNVPVGVVTAIAGANRMVVRLTGLAGHAGTVPMHLRRDALAAAALCIHEVERACSGRDDLVGTVGSIEALPGAGNVIPGEVKFTVDVRAAQDCVRHDTVEHIIVKMQALCERRKIELNIDHVHEAASVNCDHKIAEHMSAAITGLDHPVVRLPSGAGHDAAAMAKLSPVGMLFVRCKGGVSHHPDESVSTSDAISGANALLGTVLRLCQ